MNVTALRLALREVQLLIVNPMFWAVLAVIAVVLGLSGPFGTFESLSPAPRLAYWALIVPSTALAGWLAGSWVVLAFEVRGWPFWVEAIAAGLAAGVSVTLVVHLINAATLRAPLWSLAALADQAPSTAAVALTVTAGVLWLNRRAGRPIVAAPVTAVVPAARLMARIPLDKRGALVSLSVQDHYTEVTTTTGRALILLRLSDAIAEAQGVPGLQIHRSHWVALSHVTRARRDGARAVLTLKDGREVPVSRTYLPDVKGAGLL